MHKINLLNYDTLDGTKKKSFFFNSIVFNYRNHYICMRNKNPKYVSPVKIYGHCIGIRWQ